MKLTTALQLAGLLHLGLLCAGVTMPRAVNLREHLTPLPPFIRRLFWVYYVFLGLVLVGFGLITFGFADTLALRTPLARAFCLLCAVFWGGRLLVAGFVFDVRPYLKSSLLHLGYHATNLTFIYLLAVYALAAWRGGSP
ncbi:MAG: hypothetical protein HYY24_30260 [Verrucomicrobia bacterium]|nr:hypothetical protein [Verrucomicrobiota bacterium]